jgi:hypothetical protein
VPGPADTQPPTPPIGFHGSAGGGLLTLSWAPGIDNSGRIDEFVLFADGSEQARFPSTQLETTVGPFDYGDNRSFTLAETDEAGNMSGPAGPLRVVPELVGKPLDDASATLGARGFRVGSVTMATTPSAAPPGTVVSPSDPSVRDEGAAVDLVLAIGAPTPPPPSAPFVFRVAEPKALATGTGLAARVRTTRAADVAIALVDARGTEVQTWNRSLRAGATIVPLPLPAGLATGRYSVVWNASSDAERSTRRHRLDVVSAKGRPPWLAPGTRLDVLVLTGARLKPALARRLGRSAIIARADEDAAFDLSASWEHNVQVVVVDVDEHGLRFVRDLHAVFAEVRILALGSSQRVLRESVKAGATAARLRSTPRTRLAELVARLARPPARRSAGR